MLGASDFLTTEVWTKGGLVTYYIFFVIELKTRRVQIAGIQARAIKWTGSATGLFAKTLEATWQASVLALPKGGMQCIVGQERSGFFKGDRF